MGRHFISVLGTGPYQDTTYFYDEKESTTPFVQKALLEILFSNLNEDDRISIFLTEEAKAANWENRKYTEKDGKKNELSEVRIGLKEILSPQYGRLLSDTERCMIPIGKNEDELWEIFQVIFDGIEEGEELYIDITHALRNIPIQMLAVISYARVLKSIDVKGIYYGAFEVKDKSTGKTPIFNLRTFLDVLDWSQAADSFIKYGNSDQINELCEARRSVLRAKMGDLSKVVKELQGLTHGLETSRGYYNSEKERQNKGVKSTLGAYKRYKRAYNNLNENDEKRMGENEKQRNIIKPMRGILKCIDESISEFDVETNLEIGLASVKWAIDKKKTQQGFTALEETIKTFLCERYGLNDTMEDRERVAKNICRVIHENAGKLGEEIEGLNVDVREKIYMEWIGGKVEDNKRREEICEKVHRMFMTIPQELTDIVTKIGDRRNSMNHFGFSNMYQFGSEGLEKDLLLCFRDFKRVMEQMDKTEQINRKE